MLYRADKLAWKMNVVHHMWRTMCTPRMDKSGAAVCYQQTAVGVAWRRVNGVIPISTHLLEEREDDGGEGGGDGRQGRVGHARSQGRPVGLVHLQEDVSGRSAAVRGPVPAHTDAWTRLRPHSQPPAWPAPQHTYSFHQKTRLSQKATQISKASRAENARPDDL